MIQYINKGAVPNDGTSDTISQAVIKINNNFDAISKALNIKFRVVKWNSIEDSAKLADDCNYNFNLIDEKLKL